MTTVAICCELLNEPEKAEQKFQAAAKAFPDNSRVLRQSAAFYIRRGKILAAAEPLLRAIMGMQTPAALYDACWARRTLADDPRGPRLRRPRQALDLLDENLHSKAVAPMTCG